MRCRVLEFEFRERMETLQGIRFVKRHAANHVMRNQNCGYQNRSFSGLRPEISNYFARTSKAIPTPITRRANPNIIKTSFHCCCLLD